MTPAVDAGTTAAAADNVVADCTTELRAASLTLTGGLENRQESAYSGRNPLNLNEDGAVRCIERQN
jgi:hypothetical protein